MISKQQKNKIQTIGDIAYDLIKENGPMSWKEIKDGVSQRRSDLKSKDVGATVRSTLKRNKRFKKTKPGIYGLAQ